LGVAGARDDTPAPSYQFRPQNGNRPHTVLLLDVSGSMRSNLIGLQECAKAFIEDFETNGHGLVSVVAFGCRTYEITGFIDNPDMLNNSIAALRIRGRTNIQLALSTANQLLNRVPVPIDRKNIVLVSDGRSNSGPSIPGPLFSGTGTVNFGGKGNAVYRFANMLRSPQSGPGIYIYTIAINAGPRGQNLLQAMASVGGSPSPRPFYDTTWTAGSFPIIFSFIEAAEVLSTASAPPELQSTFWVEGPADVLITKDGKDEQYLFSGRKGGKVSASWGTIDFVGRNMLRFDILTDEPLTVEIIGRSGTKSRPAALNYKIVYQDDRAPYVAKDIPIVRREHFALTLNEHSVPVPELYDPEEDDGNPEPELDDPEIDGESPEAEDKSSEA
jgi:hypothetical protein